MTSRPLLMIADSETDADMLYATGLFVPDPFIFLRVRGETHLVMSDLERDRAAKHCPRFTIHSLSELRQSVIDQGIRRPQLADIARHLLQTLRVRRANVPSRFPFGLAHQLQQDDSGIQLAPITPFPERAVKTPAEIRKLRQALQMTEAGLEAGIHLIRKASVKANGGLYLRGRPLTSEQVRAAIHTEIAGRGGIPRNTIVAGGNQGCDPHERGHGRLKANVPIIIDVFPRSETTGYFGDLTRTVVRGTASEAIRQQYAAVGEAQNQVIRAIRPGALGRTLHQQVEATFDSLGYPTRRHRGHMEGFFHGTGHGLGLEIHEAPSLGKTSTDRLERGHVVTVEPGLYYPGVGGIRLEDVVVVEENGVKKLTRLPHILEL